MDNNKKVEKTVEEALKQYLEPYKDESVPEEQRITDYRLTGFGIGGPYSKGEVPTHYTIDFNVTPVNKENTTWHLRENIIFVEFKYENGEYSIEKIESKPEHWEEFLKRFEEYKKNNEENVETTSIVVEKSENYKSLQVEKINNYVYIISGIILLIGIISFIFLAKKRKK